VSQAPARILVLRRRALGDLVCSLPALADLRATYPHHAIDLVMDPEWVEAARAWAPVDRVLALPLGPLGRVRFAMALRRARYDVVIDLLSTPQTAMLSWITGARVRVGLDLSGRAWAYTRRVLRPGSALDECGRPTYVGDAMRAIVGALLLDGQRGGSPPPRAPHAPHGPARIAIAPGATWSAKAWPARAYAEVAKRIGERSLGEVTVFWAPGEEALARSICDLAPNVRLAPGGSVVDLAKGLEQHDLLVSGDSGARHLAQYLGLATVSIFGPTDPWTQTPPEGPHRFLRYPIACAPCQLATCALAVNYCMNDVTAAQVVEEVAALLARREPA
jgi:ADP-heptose:LPS heptosyltransferase